MTPANAEITSRRIVLLHRHNAAVAVGVGVLFAHHAAEGGRDVGNQHLIVNHHVLAQHFAAVEHGVAVAVAVVNFNGIQVILN